MADGELFSIYAEFIAYYNSQKIYIEWAFAISAFAIRHNHFFITFSHNSGILFIQTNSFTFSLASPTGEPK